MPAPCRGRAGAPSIQMPLPSLPRSRPDTGTQTSSGRYQMQF